MRNPAATATATATATDDSSHIEKLYEFGERLNESKDKSQNVKDYQGIMDAAKTSIKAKQLAAQLIPRFFKFFPELSSQAVETQIDLIEQEELGVRVQAIRGLPLFCKDTPEYLSKIVDILVQLLAAEEIVERDAVHKALMSLLRQDVKASLSALFKHIGTVEEPSTDELIREKVLSFVRDKVFPLKAELLRPQEEMERHITDLIKKSSEDVTGAEFRMFMDFLKKLSIFGDKAPSERMKELVGIIEGQADLDSAFDVTHVSDTDHIDRLISCLYMALPFFLRGASSSRFLNYLNKHIIPVFDKLPEERKLDLLKALAEISPFTLPQDSRQILPSVVQLLKKYMPRRKSGEEMNFTYVECLLYAFHHLAHKAPNATNSLCGYKIVTGQPSDRLGEDFSEYYTDLTERLSGVEDLTRATMKKLTQGMAEQNKAMAAAKSDEAKDSIKTQKQNTTTGLRTCNNILAMTKPLHSKTPLFIGDKSINLSWKEVAKPSVPSTAVSAGGKRPAATANGSGNMEKKGRGAGGMQNQLVSRALEGISYGGRGSPRGRGRGRGWGGRGRGRSFR
ncbi:PREDICTED: apoptosis inhibitor 5-like [Populus euphratica]|uniref:Apoptosis inhibitor 5-like n=1 Tax=Populus euphratica TaxID=75702 RepID=A0AAJ6VF05_POPEU|nr:PREDICTED: apoptosis inhibitor 5-like [Populus euphratica]XP_011045890.1 PREDICTED: apoptosis inhibitor 5-like [Populus euphratica]